MAQAARYTDWVTRRIQSAGSRRVGWVEAGWWGASRVVSIHTACRGAVEMAPSYSWRLPSVRCSSLSTQCDSVCYRETESMTVLHIGQRMASPAATLRASSTQQSVQKPRCPHGWMVAFTGSTMHKTHTS